jgi:hypothetical protein
VKSLCRFRSVSKQWRDLVSDPAFITAHESRAEPLLVSSYRNGTSLRLMDMDGNIVRRMESTDGCLTFNPNLACSDDLACFADLSPNPQVIDLTTGDMFLTRPLQATRAPRQNFPDPMVQLRLWPHRSVPSIQASPRHWTPTLRTRPNRTDLLCSHGRRWCRVEANATPHNSSHSWLSPHHRHYRWCYVLLGVPQEQISVL